MNFTYEERFLLRRIYPLIRDREETFICVALLRTDFIQHEARWKLKNKIMNLLEGSYTFDSWVKRHYEVPKLSDEEWGAKMRETRLAWITHMLEQPHP
jgi:hypothetical protein